MPYVTIDSIKYFYRESDSAGNKAASIIFIHGSGGDGSVWENQLEKLGRDYEIIIPDLPGHGKSEGSVFVTAEKYARWLESFSEKLNLQPFYLAGHSLGGAVAQAFARSFPKKTRGLILTGTGAAFNVLKEYLLLVLHDFDTAVKTSCISAFSTPVSKGLYERGREMLLRNGKDTLYSDMLSCEQFNSRPWISSVKKPAVVICGSDDKITPCRLSRDLSGLIYGSCLKIVSGAGHMVMMEAWEEFNEAVAGFVEKH